MVIGVLSYGLYFRYSMKLFKLKQKCEDAPESRSHVGFVQHSLHLPQKMYNCPCSHLESPRFTELLYKVQEWWQSQALPPSSIFWQHAFGSIPRPSSEVALMAPLEGPAMHLRFLRSWHDSVRLWTWYRREDKHTHSSPSSRSLPQSSGSALGDSGSKLRSASSPSLASWLASSSASSKTQSP